MPYILGKYGVLHVLKVPECDNGILWPTVTVIRFDGKEEELEPMFCPWCTKGESFGNGARDFG